MTCSSWWSRAEWSGWHRRARRPCGTRRPPGWPVGPRRTSFGIQLTSGTLRSSQLSKRGDALVERRVGGEQAVHAVEEADPTFGVVGGRRFLDPEVGGG